MHKLETKQALQLKTFSAGDILCIVGCQGCLGAGSFGIVQCAFHSSLGWVAVKCFPAIGGMPGKDLVVQQIQNELSALQQANHENILRAYGWAQWEGSIAVVTELMPGGSLQSLLGCDSVPLHPVLRLRMCEEVSDGTAYLHNVVSTKRLTHGDLKPENVLLTKDLHCKVGDFGSIRVAHCTGQTMATDEGISKQQMTPVYAAPERLRTISCRPKQEHDTYSYGLIVHGVLSRETPYQYSASPRDFLEGIKRGERPDTEAIDELEQYLCTNEEKEIIQVLRSVMIRCWQDKPTDRPDMRDVRDQLQQLMSKQKPSDVMLSVLQALEKMTIFTPVQSEHRLLPLNCFNARTRTFKDEFPREVHERQTIQSSTLSVTTLSTDAASSSLPKECVLTKNRDLRSTTTATISLNTGSLSSLSKEAGAICHKTSFNTKEATASPADASTTGLAKQPLDSKSAIWSTAAAATISATKDASLTVSNETGRTNQLFSLFDEATISSDTEIIQGQNMEELTNRMIAFTHAVDKLAVFQSLKINLALSHEPLRIQKNIIEQKELMSKIHMLSSKYSALSAACGGQRNTMTKNKNTDAFQSYEQFLHVEKAMNDAWIRLNTLAKLYINKLTKLQNAVIQLLNLEQIISKFEQTLAESSLSGELTKLEEKIRMIELTQELDDHGRNYEKAEGVVVEMVEAGKELVNYHEIGFDSSSRSDSDASKCVETYLTAHNRWLMAKVLTHKRLQACEDAIASQETELKNVEHVDRSSRDADITIDSSSSNQNTSTLTFFTKWFRSKPSAHQPFKTFEKKAKASKESCATLRCKPALDEVFNGSDRSKLSKQVKEAPDLLKNYASCLMISATTEAKRTIYNLTSIIENWIEAEAWELLNFADKLRKTNRNLESIPFYFAAASLCMKENDSEVCLRGIMKCVRGMFAIVKEMITDEVSMKRVVQCHIIPLMYDIKCGIDKLTSVGDKASCDYSLSVLEHIGLSEELIGDLQAAQITHDERLKRVEKTFGNEAKQREVYGRILVKLGDLHQNMSRFDDATSCYQQAIEVYKAATDVGEDSKKSLIERCEEQLSLTHS